MPYTTIRDFRRAYWIVPEHEVSALILDKAALGAYNEINSVLDGVYGVPFSLPYPGIIVDISDALTKQYAIWIIAGGRNTEPLTEYAEAMKKLDELRTGDRELPGLARATTKAAWFNTADYTPIFDVDDPRYHVADEDRLEDIYDDRAD